MSIKRFMFRKGTIGGTARWAANGYRSFVVTKRHTGIAELSLESLCVFLVDVRPMSAMEKSIFYDIAANVRSLDEFVEEVLSLEGADLNDLGSDCGLAREVIRQELIRGGVPGEFVRGFLKKISSGEEKQDQQDSSEAHDTQVRSKSQLGGISSKEALRLVQQGAILQGWKKI